MALAFSREKERFGKRLVRRSLFEPRSELPISAACLVANGIRESLTHLLARAVSVMLTPPVLLASGSWSTIVAGARLFRLRGTVTDIALLLRPADALALVHALFDEQVTVGVDGSAPRDLSPIERDMLDQLMRSLSGALDAVAGLREGAQLEQVTDTAPYSTYFELLIGEPIDARLAVMLKSEPVPTVRDCFTLGDLLDIDLELNVRFPAGCVDARTLLGLQPGAIVPMTTEVGSTATLNVAESVLARGECGAVAGRSAFLVGNYDGN
ncbi:MAG: FliM/FliN family flagellar motor switch protein [Candidatus Eremiobacteraeota bacterium]|nr:FliM/FliN family flagellar motor switch protein [Candidatus Eremiobacteraeota bacterium]